MSLPWHVWSDAAKSASFTATLIAIDGLLHGFVDPPTETLRQRNELPAPRPKAIDHERYDVDRCLGIFVVVLDVNEWGTLDETGKGRLPLLGDRDTAALAMALARTTAAPIHALIDAVAERALKGPTELLPDELATLFPTPPDPDDRFVAERMLQKAGITWPGVPENPEASRGADT